MNELEDIIVGDVIALRFAIAELTLHLARREPNPENWVRALIARLHGLIDQNALAMRQRHGLPEAYGHHEFARQGVDQLGSMVLDLMQPE